MLFPSVFLNCLNACSIIIPPPKSGFAGSAAYLLQLNDASSCVYPNKHMFVPPQSVYRDQTNPRSVPQTIPVRNGPPDPFLLSGRRAGRARRRTSSPSGRGDGPARSPRRASRDRASRIAPQGASARGGRWRKRRSEVAESGRETTRPWFSIFQLFFLVLCALRVQQRGHKLPGESSILELRCGC